MGRTITKHLAREQLPGLDHRARLLARSGVGVRQNGAEYDELEMFGHYRRRVNR